ncbi:hypothetical protein EZY14_017260 [Kordia sp. TARA_039_SRF]|nr:hypothetical protein EZY14_017260 [Kordia sp. TARA_039_SRF]
MIFIQTKVFLLNEINFKKLKISSLFSYSLLAQRKETKEKALFQRCFWFSLLGRKPKPHEFF